MYTHAHTHILTNTILYNIYMYDVYDTIVGIVMYEQYSEYSLILSNSFSKNMVDKRVWWTNLIFIGTCTLYWYWEIVAD